MAAQIRRSAALLAWLVECLLVVASPCPHVVQMYEAGSLWVLKRDVHRAQGVHVLPFWQASKEVRLLAHIS